MSASLISAARLPTPQPQPLVIEGISIFADPRVPDGEMHLGHTPSLLLARVDALMR